MAALVIAATPARADELLRGIVVDDATGRGIAGAVIAAGPTTTETGADGRFAIEGVAEGAPVLVVAPGYLPRELGLGARLALHAGGTVEIIEVTGKAPDPASPTSYALGRDQIRALPGSGNDVLRALQSLPGVSRTSYGIGGLVLRGASPHESAVFLDGIEVPLAFHFGGVSSFYPSTLLDEVVLTPGGSDVVFGRGIGGTVELRSRAPRGDRHRVGGEVGVFDASAYAEAPLAGGAIALGLRRSYADAILARVQAPDRQLLPRYYDGQLRWDRALGGGTLSVLGVFSDDAIAAWGGTSYAQGFARGALRWRRAIGLTAIAVTPWAGWGRTELKYLTPSWFGDERHPQTLRVERLPLGLRADLRRDADWGHVAGGVDLQAAAVSLTEPDELLGEGTTTRRGQDLDAGFWLEARWRIADGRLTLKPGVRVDYLGTAEAWVIEPRAVVTHEVLPWLTLREAFGIYHQPPGPASITSDDDAERVGLVVRGLHASVGARLQLPESIIVAVTGYHAAMRGPVDDRPDSERGSELGDFFGRSLGLVFENLIGEEFGGIRPDRRRNFGLELSAQRRSEHWLTWLSYTRSHAERHANKPTLDGWVTESLDQTHNFNLVVSVRDDVWQLGARVRYTTGLPYTPRTSVSIDEDGDEEVTYGPANSRRLDAFMSLDLRLDRRWTRPWGTVSAFLDVQNLTNHANPEGVGFDDGTTRAYGIDGLPILPMIGVAFAPRD